GRKPARYDGRAIRPQVNAGFSPRSDILRITRKRRRGFRWLPMMRRLLISIRHLQKSSLIVGTSHKSDTCGKVVRVESRGNRDGGNKHEEGIQSPPPISPSVVLARIMAPAFLCFSATNESRSG